jgi:hypothetical protein
MVFVMSNGGETGSKRIRNEILSREPGIQKIFNRVRK